MYSAIQTGGQLGMQTLDQCLKQLLQANTITKEAAQEKAKMPDDFK
jgi:twitching motility protein PilT